LELPPHRGSDILDVVQSAQKPFQFEEFSVVLVIEPGLDRDAVVYLIAEGMRRVVNEDSLGQISPQNIQVLQVVPLYSQTGFTIEAVVNVFTLFRKQIRFDGGVRMVYMTN
jgi:hypothetical protein